MKLERLTKQDLIKILSKICSKLDELDGEDFFGSEGWKHFLDLEDDL